MNPTLADRLRCTPRLSRGSIAGRVRSSGPCGVRRAVDLELRALWDEIEAGRLAGQGRFAGMLAERGVLRPGVSVEQARDLVWTLCSLAVHDLLVVSRGWTSERYQEWLAAALTRELLPDDRA